MADGVVGGGLGSMQSSGGMTLNAGGGYANSSSSAFPAANGAGLSAFSRQPHEHSQNQRMESFAQGGQRQTDERRRGGDAGYSPSWQPQQVYSHGPLPPQFASPNMAAQMQNLHHQQQQQHQQEQRRREHLSDYGELRDALDAAAQPERPGTGSGESGNTAPL